MMDVLQLLVEILDHAITIYTQLYKSYLRIKKTICNDFRYNKILNI